MIQYFSGCLSTQCTLIDQWVNGKITSLPFVLFSHWSIPNMNVHWMDKQPEKHSTLLEAQFWLNWGNQAKQLNVEPKSLVHLEKTITRLHLWCGTSSQRFTQDMWHLWSAWCFSVSCTSSNPEGYCDLWIELLQFWDLWHDIVTMPWALSFTAAWLRSAGMQVIFSTHKFTHDSLPYSS